VSIVLIPARAQSVVNAREAWIAAGLPSRIADQKAAALAERMGAKQLAAMKRAKSSPVSRAAARHEKEVRDLFLAAVQKAQNAISLDKLEAGLSLGHIPWDVLEPAIQKMTETLTNG